MTGKSSIPRRIPASARKRRTDLAETLDAKNGPAGLRLRGRFRWVNHPSDGAISTARHHRQCQARRCSRAMAAEICARLRTGLLIRACRCGNRRFFGLYPCTARLVARAPDYRLSLPSALLAQPARQARKPQQQRRPRQDDQTKQQVLPPAAIQQMVTERQGRHDLVPAHGRHMRRNQRVNCDQEQHSTVDYNEEIERPSRAQITPETTKPLPERKRLLLAPLRRRTHWQARHSS